MTATNKVQAILDRHFAPGCDAIWADPRLTVDEKIERWHRLWLKVAARITRETGYAL